MADPRAADVAEADRLLAAAADEGVARLPVLSTGELWVLCGDQQVLADEAEARWWTSMSEPERAKYAAMIIDFLLDRGLLRRPDATDPGPAAGGPELPMAPELAMIVAARQRPAVVVVGSLADGSAGEAPRMYGLADAGQPPRVLIGDVNSPASQPAFGPLHHFSLMSPVLAGRVLALWATAPGAPGKGGFLSRKKDRTKIVDLYHNRPGEQLTRDRLTVLPGESGQFQVSRQSPGTEPTMPVTHDLDQLADLLTAMLTGAAG